MSDSVIIFFLICVIMVLLSVIICQQFAYRKGIKAKLKTIIRKLSDIVDNDSDEKVMIFTDNRTLRDLCGQINRLLLDRQKMKSDFRMTNYILWPFSENFSFPDSRTYLLDRIISCFYFPSHTAYQGLLQENVPGRLESIQLLGVSGDKPHGQSSHQLPILSDSG